MVDARNGNRRPAENETATGPTEGMHHDLSSISPASNVRQDGARQIPTLAEMSGWGRVVATAYFAAGRAEGYAAGYAAAEADIAALQRRAAAVAHELGSPRAVPYAELADRRGEHAAADRQRAILRERGIA